VLAWKKKKGEEELTGNHGGRRVGSTNLQRARERGGERTVQTGPSPRKASRSQKGVEKGGAFGGGTYIHRHRAVNAGGDGDSEQHAAGGFKIFAPPPAVTGASCSVCCVPSAQQYSLSADTHRI
jgi:hypothetical protein